MTDWYWVRHGPTHEKTFVGWRDVPADLSDTDQVARLHAFLPSPALLVSSDLIRASATADAISLGRTRLPDDPDLREFNFGEWDGKRFDEVASAYPDLSRSYWETPGDIAPPGGESWNAAARRVSRRVDIIAARNPGAIIIAVAHIGVIMTQLQRAGHAAATEVIARKIDNLSVTHLRLDHDRWEIRCINHRP